MRSHHEGSVSSGLFIFALNKSAAKVVILKTNLFARMPHCLAEYHYCLKTNTFNFLKFP
jgi:hypothetical protein